MQSNIDIYLSESAIPYRVVLRSQPRSYALSRSLGMGWREPWEIGCSGPRHERHFSLQVGRPVPIVSNFCRWGQLFAVLAASSNFCLFKQFLSKIRFKTHQTQKIQRFHRKIQVMRISCVSINRKVIRKNQESREWAWKNLISINYRKKRRIVIQRPRIYNCFGMNNYVTRKYSVVQGSHSEPGRLVVSPTFASNYLKVIFKPFFFTDVNYHCVEQNVKLLISV